MSGYNALRPRVKRAWDSLFKKDNLNDLFDPKTFWKRLRWRLLYARMTLKTEKSFPDGGLQDGSILTQWEEDGEYIQLVQPSVGVLVANFLLEDPDNPHAVLIAAEISRIRARYRDRLLAEKAAREEAADPDIAEPILYDE